MSKLAKLITTKQRATNDVILFKNSPKNYMKIKVAKKFWKFSLKKSSPSLRHLQGIISIKNSLSYLAQVANDTYPLL